MKRLAPLFILLALLASCRNGNTPAADAGLVQMQVGKETFKLEVARTEAEVQMGLMFRESMPQDHGMIFVFSSPQARSFWMKNTKIPLDIVFLNAEGRIVSIHPLEPLNEQSVWSDAPAQYAIELNRGSAARAGIKAGDKLEIPDKARWKP